MRLSFIFLVRQLEPRGLRPDRARTDRSDDQRISDGSDGGADGEEEIRPDGGKSHHHLGQGEGDLQPEETELDQQSHMKTTYLMNSSLWPRACFRMTYYL